MSDQNLGSSWFSQRVAAAKANPWGYGIGLFVVLVIIALAIYFIDKEAFSLRADPYYLGADPYYRAYREAENNIMWGQAAGATQYGTQRGDLQFSPQQMMGRITIDEIQQSQDEAILSGRIAPNQGLLGGRVATAEAALYGAVSQLEGELRSANEFGADDVDYSGAPMASSVVNDRALYNHHNWVKQVQPWSSTPTMAIVADSFEPANSTGFVGPYHWLRKKPTGASEDGCAWQVTELNGADYYEGGNSSDRKL
jgi:hypothetical protein